MSKWVGREFASVSELQSWLRQPDIDKMHRKYWDPAMEKIGGGFKDTAFIGREVPSRKTAIDFLTTPYPEGESLLHTAKAAVGHVTCSLQAESITRRPRLSEDNGAEINVDRWLERQPDFWVDFRPVRKTGKGTQKILHLVADFSSQSNYRPEQIAWRGAAVIILADILETAGYRCQISFNSVSEGYYANGTGGWYRLAVKQPNEPVNFATLAAINSSWAYRTIGFLTKCQQPGEVNPTMGRIRNDPKDWPVECQPKPGDILCHGLFSQSAAVEWIRSTLATLNGKEQK